MRIDLTCPVELWHFKLPTKAYPVVSLQLFNLSQKAVVSVQAAFLCFDEQDSQFARQVERIQGLSGDARSAFEVIAAVEDGVDAWRMDILIEKVWFEDGTVWRRGAGQMSEYQSNRLDPSRQLDTLRKLAGQDALGYPSDQGSVWVCVCGRPNAASATQCFRCEREKHAQFTRYNKATIETVLYKLDSELEEKAQAARLAAGLMQEEREKQELARKKRIKISLYTFLALVLLAAGAYGVVVHGIPYYHYYQAGQLLQNRQFDQAREAYLALEDYRDSQSLAQEADYQKAGSYQQNGNVTALKSAEDLYLSLGEYKDSNLKHRQAQSRRAQLLLGNLDYAQAIPLLEGLGSFEDADNRALQARYDWAKKRMDELDYEGARELFLALSDYQDAKTLADDCLYLPAMAHLDNKEYAKAEALLLQLPHLQRAQLSLQQTYYAWGDMLFAAQQFDEAAEQFLAAGDYLDAFRRASECLYEPALLLFREGKYQEAKDKFDQIAAFEDSALMSQHASYQLGLVAMDEADYKAARQHFLAAPDVAESLGRLMEASYHLAQQALERGEYAQAADLFLEAGTYEDAAQQAGKARFDLGIQLSNQQDYQGAQAAFAQIPNYPGAAEELQRSRYNQAIQLLEQGMNQEAAAAFLALSGYAQSEEYLQTAQYQLAMSQLADKQYEDAANQFLALGNYQDAVQRYQEARHEQALDALNSGDLETAITYLTDIQDYANAGELYTQSVYQLAGKHQQAGDLGEAARLFGLIPDYQDAATLRDNNYDSYFEAAYQTAQQGMKNKQYKVVIDALSGLDRDNTGEKYKDIQLMYQDANYRYADELYAQNKPYEALVYYRNILDYKDVKTRKLERTAYQIIGKWESTRGVIFEFRDDGTCTMDGKEMYYFARNYALQVGDRPGELDITYQIVNLRDTTLSIQHQRTKTLYKCTRVE